MDSKKLIQDLCSSFRYDLSVVNNTTKVHENALRRGYDKKHKPLALVVGSLYFYCKSTGKPITLAKLLENVYVEQEEVLAVYNDLKKEALH